MMGQSVRSDVTSSVLGMADRPVSEVQIQIIRAALGVLLRALQEIRDGAENPQEIARQALDDASTVVGEI